MPAIGSTVDIAKGTYENTIGTADLKTVWTDPDFDPSVDAFYYARVLAIPTPRWTTIQSAQQHAVPPSVVPLTVQDRAWSSPIWYTPTVETRQTAAPGIKVAEMQQQGATALDETQLKQLGVGKTVNLRNTVTGHRFEILYGSNGQRLITALDGKTPDPDTMGDLSFDPETRYEIRGGRLVTYIGGTPFEVTVYKLGSRYVAARRDEFGFANYEVETAKQ